MKLKDYGETVLAIRRNLMGQEVDSKKFDSLFKAWEWAEENIDDSMFSFKIHKENTIRTIQVRPYFKKSCYIISSKFSRVSFEVQSIGEIYDAMGKVLVSLKFYKCV